MRWLKFKNVDNLYDELRFRYDGNWGNGLRYTSLSIELKFIKNNGMPLHITALDRHRDMTTVLNMHARNRKCPEKTVW